MPYLHEANLADLNSPRRGEANEWRPNKNMRPNANTGRGITKGKCRYAPGHVSLLPLDRCLMQKKITLKDKRKSVNGSGML